MIPMNFMKSKAGFTLVELIVVIAILGILAGIAVPAYSGYIKKANNAADTATLAAVKTACESACALEDNVEKIIVTATSGPVTNVAVYYSTAANATAAHTFAWSGTAWSCASGCGIVGDFSTYMNDGTVELKASTSATLSGGTWTLTPKS